MAAGEARRDAAGQGGTGHRYCRLSDAHPGRFIRAGQGPGERWERLCLLVEMGVGAGARGAREELLASVVRELSGRDRAPRTGRGTTLLEAADEDLLDKLAALCGERPVPASLFHDMTLQLGAEGGLLLGLLLAELALRRGQTDSAAAGGMLAGVEARGALGLWLDGLPSSALERHVLVAARLRALLCLPGVCL